MFSSILTEGLTPFTAVMCIVSSLIVGFMISITYINCGKHSKSFAMSLVILPILVQVVIMLVNGNLGTGVAVLGAFSLIRFRSVPGNSKDICTIFFAMATGLAIGMGYITYALIITVFLCFLLLVLTKTNFGGENFRNKELCITIPEDLNYTNIFDDIFEKYTKNYNLISAKTTNLGSMFQLKYEIALKDNNLEKEFIDDLRCRNGNLNISCSTNSVNADTL